MSTVQDSERSLPPPILASSRSAPESTSDLTTSSHSTSAHPRQMWSFCLLSPADQQHLRPRLCGLPPPAIVLYISGHTDTDLTMKGALRFHQIRQELSLAFLPK